LQPPEERIMPYLSDVEKKAYLTVKDGEVLVFGHTHRPFIRNDSKIVNTGSWVKDAAHSRFVENKFQTCTQVGYDKREKELI
jgi:predicted phosphodiesterase